MPTGIERIAAERQRQIEKEGWTPEHDDQHEDSELAFAACYYAIPCGVRNDAGDWITPSDLFPGEWDYEWAKRGDDRIRNLEKAGALIAAEIDRLQRKGGNEG